MNFAIRVDSSKTIGSGHLMRCLTLASQLKSLKHEVTFICGDHEGSFHELCIKQGFKVLIINIPAAELIQSVDSLRHAAWLGRSQEADAQETTALIKDLKIDWMVIDHYGIDIRWESIVRSVVSNIFVVDDLADRQHDCDLLLDQNYYLNAETRYQGLLPLSAIALLGPSYALLRPEFIASKKKFRIRDSVASTVMVYFGGTDVFGLTCKAVKTLARFPKIKDAAIILGKNNAEESEIRSVATQQGWQVYSQVENMAELMIKCDLAIGASGATSWERCVVGLPSIITALADNQEQIAKDLTSIGAVISIPRDLTTWEQNLTLALDQMLTHPELLKKMSAAAGQVVGDSKSIVDEILKFNSSVLADEILWRKARMDDAKTLYDWRNDLLTRESSVNKTELKWGDHLAWLEKTLKRLDTEIYIAKLNGEDVGTVRRNFVDGRLELSWAVNPKHRGHGLGKRLVTEAAAKSKRPVYARILPHNQASAKIAEAAGFKFLTREPQTDWWVKEQ